MKTDIKKKIPAVESQGWDAKRLAEEASNEDYEDILRKILRGNESDGNADERDIADAATEAEKSQNPEGKENLLVKEEYKNG